MSMINQRLVLLQTPSKLSIALLILLCSIGCQSLKNNAKPRETFLSNKTLGPAALSPDGNEIVFSAEDKGGKTSQIYRASIDGKDLVALTTNPAYNYGPVFSPDGTQILFSSMSDGKQGDLYLMKPDGSKKQALTSGSDHDYSAIFSHNGNTIFFVRARRFGRGSTIAPKSWHDMDIFSVQRDGTDLKRITFLNSHRIGYLSISPDDRTLGATIRSLHNPSIWMIPIENPDNRWAVRPDLKAHRKVSYDELHSSEISPDGKDLLFLWGHNPTDRFFITNLATNQTQTLRFKEKQIHHPRFSMDGTQIIFNATYHSGFFKTHEESNFYLVRRNGTGLDPIDFRSKIGG
jgi:Tol biopolymer transport system component